MNFTFMEPMALSMNQITDIIASKIVWTKNVPAIMQLVASLVTEGINPEEYIAAKLANYELKATDIGTVPKEALDEFKAEIKAPINKYNSSTTDDILREMKAIPADETVSDEKTMMLVVSDIEVKAGPGKKNEKVGVIPAGTVVFVAPSINSGWLKIGENEYVRQLPEAIKKCPTIQEEPTTVIEAEKLDGFDSVATAHEKSSVVEIVRENIEVIPDIIESTDDEEPYAYVGSYKSHVEAENIKNKITTATGLATELVTEGTRIRVKVSGDSVVKILNKRGYKVSMH